VHAARRRERGFDQAEELARGVGRLLQLDVARCLRREQRTAAQHALGRSARARNVGHAFGIAPRSRPVAGAWVILVDDVMTTGATLNGCAAALRAAGARAVSALTLARER
jgi:ComF family protein